MLMIFLMIKYKEKIGRFTVFSSDIQTQKPVYAINPFIFL